MLGKGIAATALLLLLACAGAAHADVTAVFTQPNVFTYTVELRSNGDMRREIPSNGDASRGILPSKPGAYMLMLQGQCFDVVPTPSGMVVDRCDDAAAALFAVENERAPSSAKDLHEASKNMPDLQYFTKRGLVTVHGREGTAYYLLGQQTGTPYLVISTDPELAPMGAMTARELAIAMGPAPMPPDNPIVGQMEAILNSGCPLTFAGAELTSVSHGPIDPARFALPGPPETQEAIMKRLRAQPRGHVLTIR